MVQLVNKSTLEIVSTRDEIALYGGPLGAGIADGSLVWCTVPAGVHRLDTVAVNNAGVISVVEDAAKKAARLAAEADNDTKRTQALAALDAIRTFDESTIADATLRPYLRNVKRVLVYLAKNIG